MPTPTACTTLVAQSRQRAEGRACLLVMVVGVMHERDIDSVEPEPVEASVSDRSAPSYEKSK